MSRQLCSSFTLCIIHFGAWLINTLQVTLKVDRTNLNIDIGVNAPSLSGYGAKGGVRWFRRFIRITLLSVSSLACQAGALARRHGGPWLARYASPFLATLRFTRPLRPTAWTTARSLLRPRRLRVRLPYAAPASLAQTTSGPRLLSSSRVQRARPPRRRVAIHVGSRPTTLPSEPVSLARLLYCF